MLCTPGGAKGTERAAFTMGTAGGAHRPAVEHHAVAEIAGLFRGKAEPKLLFNLEGILAAVGQAQAARDADAMGVAHITLLAENISQNEVGRLTAYAGQTQEIVHSARHLAAVVGKQHFGAGHQVSCLGPLEPAGVVLPVPEGP